MERQIELPKRVENHVRETSGYKILENKIPSDWIIRYVTERDYGVDCYIELVDEQKRLTGEIAFVQMKATDKIDWRHDKGFRFYKVGKTTTNYLKSFLIPTYIFLVDLSTDEMFFVSIKEYLSEHYEEYMRPGIFAYEFYHDNDSFTVDTFVKSFRRNNQYNQFRNELQYFNSDLHHYIDFMQEHNNRDSFMQIEPEDMIFFEAMHRNISFLQNYFGTINKLTPVEILYERGKTKYGDAYEHTLLEGVLTDIYDEFKASVVEIFDIIKELVTQKERYYWLMERFYVFNCINNMNIDKLFDY